MPLTPPNGGDGGWDPVYCEGSDSYGLSLYNDVLATDIASSRPLNPSVPPKLKPNCTVGAKETL
jgi:hypothetical protein